MDDVYLDYLVGERLTPEEWSVIRCTDADIEVLQCTLNDLSMIMKDEAAYRSLIDATRAQLNVLQNFLIRPAMMNIRLETSAEDGREGTY